MSLLPTFANQLPQSLAQELQSAIDLDVVPVKITDEKFDKIVAQGRVKWAVRTNGDLLVIPEFINGQEIYHTVLSEGDPVLAAGLADIVGSPGNYLLLWISNYSGHYLPTVASLELGKTVFQQSGIDISQVDVDLIGQY